MWKKIKNFVQRFKKILLIAIFGGVALAAGLGAIMADPIQSSVDDVVFAQNNYKNINGKFKQVERTLILNTDITYQVDEYVSPKDVGYQITFFKAGISATGTPIILKKGYGVGSESQIYDWK